MSIFSPNDFLIGHCSPIISIEAERAQLMRSRFPQCVCAYMCVCMCARMCVCAHVCVHACMCACIYVQAGDFPYGPEGQQEASSPALTCGVQTVQAVQVWLSPGDATENLQAILLSSLVAIGWKQSLSPVVCRNLCLPCAGRRYEKQKLDVVRTSWAHTWQPKPIKCKWAKANCLWRVRRHGAGMRNPLTPSWENPSH